MILDDLFAFATQNSTPANQVTVKADVTTNDELRTQTNTAAAPPALLLVYVPGQELKVHGIPTGFLAASFRSTELTVTALRPSFRGGDDTYTIKWQGSVFAANVDGTTNIVYGAAAQQFIAISLCRELVLELLSNRPVRVGEPMILRAMEPVSSALSLALLYRWIDLRRYVAALLRAFGCGIGVETGAE